MGCPTRGENSIRHEGATVRERYEGPARHHLTGRTLTRAQLHELQKRGSIAGMKVADNHETSRNPKVSEPRHAKVKKTPVFCVQKNGRNSFSEGVLRRREIDPSCAKPNIV